MYPQLSACSDAFIENLETDIRTKGNKIDLKMWVFIDWDCEFLKWVIIDKVQWNFWGMQKYIQSTLEIAALDLTVSIFGPKEIEIFIFTLDLAVLSK
jgi:hypothetical protein